MNLVDTQHSQPPDRRETPFESILASYKSNRYNRWIGDDPQSAQQRFRQDFFYVNSTPKFRFSRKDRFFAIGSCFARNIERELAAQGIACLTAGTNIPAEYYAADRDERAAMNKFNIPSMIDEIDRTFDPGFAEEGRYIEIAADQYFDPATSGLKLLPLSDHAVVREEIRRVTARIAEADAVILTLGLVEMWRDRISGLHLNTSPHPAAMKKESRLAKAEGRAHRFVHMRPNFAFLRGRMHGLVDRIHRVAPEARIVVSVSPVPLQATMTADDVVCSSTLSKALLRVVAEDARESYDFVDYFPSYEMVMSSPRAMTWEADEVHVRTPLVAQVTRAFSQNWIA